MTIGEEKLLAVVMKQTDDPLDFKNLSHDVQQQLEALCLDPEDKDISSNSQTEKTTRRVKYIHDNQVNLDVLQHLLAEYELNDGVYDESHNRQGIFLEVGAQQKNRARALTCALYVLTAKRLSLLADFLGVQDHYIHRKKYYSHALFNKAAEVESQRRQFPLKHFETIPVLKECEQQIKELAGLTIGDIFESTAIPPISHKKFLSLTKILKAYILAISGKYTITTIARSAGISRQVFLRVFSNKMQYVQFTPQAKQVLEDKIMPGI